MNAKRGYVPEDERNFSPEAVEKMCKGTWYLYCILRDVDRTLYGMEGVITSDSIILDHCSSWINLTSECLKRKNKQAICVW